MTIALTAEQCRSLAQDGQPPIRVIDPATNASYVLLREDQYQKIRALVEAQTFDPAEAYPLMDEVARSTGWDDPALDVYNDMVPQPNS